MLVNWRPKAQESLLQIVDYISNQNPLAAFELYDAIKRAAHQSYHNILICTVKADYQVQEKSLFIPITWLFIA